MVTKTSLVLIVCGLVAFFAVGNGMARWHCENNGGEVVREGSSTSCRFETTHTFDLRD